MRQLAYDWHSEKFYHDVKKEVEKNGQCILDWSISKVTMIATLNYLRSKGLKCEWIEKSQTSFDIKITLPPNTK